MTTPEPTPEMVAFFERRTHEHIDRVRRCLAAMAEGSDYGEALMARARVHDASKFGPEERVPYIWLTEYHRCRYFGEPFAYPDGVERTVRAAIAHHLAVNRHHPEFHADANDMSEVDLIEMVCDWTAMAQELGDGGGSARTWADRTIGSTVLFDADRRGVVYATIDRLDARLGAGPQR